MFDTGVLKRALGNLSHEPKAKGCVDLFNAMVAEEKTIYVSAPSIAELQRNPDAATWKLPAVKGVVVVPFDKTAAEILAKKFPYPDMTKIAKDQQSSIRAVAVAVRKHSAPIGGSCRIYQGARA